MNRLSISYSPELQVPRLSEYKGMVIESYFEALQFLVDLQRMAIGDKQTLERYWRDHASADQVIACIAEHLQRKENRMVISIRLHANVSEIICLRVLVYGKSKKLLVSATATFLHGRLMNFYYPPRE